DLAGGRRLPVAKQSLQKARKRCRLPSVLPPGLLFLLAFPGNAGPDIGGGRKRSDRLVRGWGRTRYDLGGFSGWAVDTDGDEPAKGHRWRAGCVSAYSHTPQIDQRQTEEETDRTSVRRITSIAFGHYRAPHRHEHPTHQAHATQPKNAGPAHARQPRRQGARAREQAEGSRRVLTFLRLTQRWGDRELGASSRVH
uniref:Uncharacterized protein n=1 Tax=Triticum urartu TaxID=4572 RepID=A0A8R7QYD0_TRIUA